jgi:hypothetical protein
VHFLVLFLDLAAGQANPDTAVYAQALKDLHVQSDRVYEKRTHADRCHSTVPVELSPDTLASFERRNHDPLLIQSVEPLFMGALMNREPATVRLSAVGWSHDRGQAWVEVAVKGFEGKFRTHCLLYRMEKDGLHLWRTL